MRERLYSELDNSPQLRSFEGSKATYPPAPCLSELHTRLIFYLQPLTKTNADRVRNDNIPRK